MQKAILKSPDPVSNVFACGPPIGIWVIVGQNSHVAFLEVKPFLQQVLQTSRVCYAACKTPAHVTWMTRVPLSF